MERCGGGRRSGIGPVTVLLCCSLQGSYGVVKLAYNEDDNTYYVRQTHERQIQRPLVGSCWRLGELCRRSVEQAANQQAPPGCSCCL